ncbi:hypothetical protein [Microbaculum marinum]|uniref:Cytochrome P460 domain-containing protein n=1 Tax=Microbaculum marinum TaxID=1764581 RepID=A0AAW9S455_9HYPH
MTVLAVGLLAARDLSAQDACTVLEDCSGYTALPTAAQCAVDDCTCAQQVECYLRNEDPGETWPVLPGQDRALNRNFFHDRFIETRISPKSLDSWIRFTDPSIETVDLPDKTVLYKSGYMPKDRNIARPENTPSSAYVFVKLDGYCPDGSSVGRFCLGGDWFSVEVAEKNYGILTKGTLVDEGKSSKCFGCHAAAEKGDWSWQLFSRRRYP